MLRLRLRLCNVLVDQAADSVERAVQATGQRVHTRSCSESHQRENETVFHQTLARLVLVEASEKAQNKGLH
jgi:hypothetical protein